MTQKIRVASPTPRIELVCIDIDGTLVGSDGVASADVWSAAERLRARGVRVAICSGRPALGVAFEYAQRLDAGGWHSFQNGASVIHFGTRESRSAPLSGESVTRLIGMARTSGRMLELYTDSAYAIEATGPRAREHAALLGVPFAPRAFESLQDPVVRAQWMVSFAETAAILAEPYPGLEVSASTSPVMPDTQFISLTRAGIDKGYAVRLIADAHAVPLAQVMFVGDSANDLPAMRIVGVPVAMANSERHVIAAAQRVVGHVDAGGLADALDWAAKCARA